MVSARSWPSFSKLVLRSNDYVLAQRYLRTLDASGEQIRWAQGVIHLADWILDWTPAAARAQKSVYLQTIEERASVESEESGTEQD